MFRASFSWFRGRFEWETFRKGSVILTGSGGRGRMAWATDPAPPQLCVERARTFPRVVFAPGVSVKDLGRAERWGGGDLS